MSLAHKKLERYKHLYDRFSEIVKFETFDVADLKQIFDSLSVIPFTTESIEYIHPKYNRFRQIVQLINQLETYAKDIDEHFEKYHAKDLLQQYTQGVDKTLPVYKTVAVHGPAHKPEFEIEVVWQDKVLATAIGKTKKEAQQNCAYEACKALGVINQTDDVNTRDFPYNQYGR